MAEMSMLRSCKNTAVLLLYLYFDSLKHHTLHRLTYQLSSSVFYLCRQLLGLEKIKDMWGNLSENYEYNIRRRSKNVVLWYTRKFLTVDQINFNIISKLSSSIPNVVATKTTVLEPKVFIY